MQLKEREDSIQYKLRKCREKIEPFIQAQALLAMLCSSQTLKAIVGDDGKVCLNFEFPPEFREAMAELDKLIQLEFDKLRDELRNEHLSNREGR